MKRVRLTWGYFTADKWEDKNKKNWNRNIIVDHFSSSHSTYTFDSKTCIYIEMVRALWRKEHKKEYANSSENYLLIQLMNVGLKVKKLHKNVRNYQF